ncbi:hypothetical protein KI387_038746, partial [Taxus chinensis]
MYPFLKQLQDHFFDLVTLQYTRGKKALRVEDSHFQLLEQQNFSLLPARRNRGTHSASTPPVKDRNSKNNIPPEQLSPNLLALILAGVSVPLQTIFPQMAAPLPWGQWIGPLALPQPLHELPRSSRK